jgi:hypothetical protein
MDAGFGGAESPSLDGRLHRPAGDAAFHEQGVGNAETRRHKIDRHHGAGPIVIGQACEFDYSGTQACKVLKDEGYRVILINSNPATIMTDPDLADATYIEPITPETVAMILEFRGHHTYFLISVCEKT